MEQLNGVVGHQDAEQRFLERLFARIIERTVGYGPEVRRQLTELE